jgi:hypothetical protein
VWGGSDRDGMGAYWGDRQGWGCLGRRARSLREGEPNGELR